MMRSRLGRFLALVLAAVLLGGLWVAIDANRPYLRSGTPADVDIAPGTSTRRIARQLENDGVIRSRYTFLLLHSLRPKQTIKAGSYSFEKPATPRAVLLQLVRGEVAYRKLTIPEGYNRFQIARLVEEGGFATRDAFLQASMDTALIADLDPQAPSLEGYLFPDTYEFPRHSDARKIVRTMVNRFRQVYNSLVTPDVKFPVREVVRIASMVEMETANPEERPLVASVFYNRLRKGIPLQCDPTVIYAAVLQNTYDGIIRQKDLNSQSPYNTYTHAGLPPGAISNPGRASLLAAMHPATTQYLYFVANATGHHTFSRTLAEHNLAVSLYRRSLRSDSAGLASGKHMP